MLLSVESFLTEDERLELLCEAFSAAESDWYSNTVKPENYWAGRKLEYASETMKMLDLRVSNYFRDYERISPFHSIQRIPMNDYMGEHDDKNVPENKFGCVAYINDNYEGGELVYPRLGLSIKPKAGMLVVHASGEPHLINTVKGHPRYMITCFVYGGRGKDPQITERP